MGMPKIQRGAAMARREALLRITKLLLNRRNMLRKRLGTDLDELAQKNTFTSGDAADAAFETSGEEVASQLAELEAKELAQIEFALRRIKQGLYGICNGCEGKIPVARLNALPYSVLCIKCQRESETDASWFQDRMTTDWNKITDTNTDDRDISLSEIEIDLSK